MSSAASIQPVLSAETLVDVQNLSKRFPVAWDFFGRPSRFVSAVDDVSLTIRKGETLALVGESGSGKSTLARLVMRLAPVTSGSVTFQGKDIIKMPGKELRTFREKAQMIFQDPYESLDPRFTAARVVAEGMSHLSLSSEEKKSRIAEVLNLVHLPSDAAQRFPHEFSGGQRQRVSIARALAVNPSFIVADEPVSALDVSMQSQILNLMRELQDRLGLTYLFISHDMSVVRHMADRVAVMYLGRVVEIAPAEELFSNPLHPYTQALLSSVPTLLKGRPGQRIAIPGEASVVDDRPNCRFANRCFRSLERCRSEKPILTGVLRHPDHWVACFNSAPLLDDGAVA